MRLFGMKVASLLQGSLVVRSSPYLYVPTRPCLQYKPTMRNISGVGACRKAHLPFAESSTMT